jgi:hypothetical protein
VRESAVSPIISSATAASSGLVAGSPMGVAIASAKVAQIVRSTCRAMVYAKMRYAVVALLIISSAAFATGSGVVQQIKAHLPSINLTGWIKPLFRSIIPNLQASNTSNQDALAPLDHTVAAPDPKLTIDVDHIAEPRVTINPAPAHASQPIVSAPHVVAVAPVAKAPEPELNDVARAILNPPLYVNAARKPAGVTSSSLSISATSDSAKTESTSHDANETVAASSGDTFSLGAGGGGGFGKADVYVMPAGASLRNQTMIVGDAAGGFGVFRQLGGVNKIDGSLIVGHEQGSKGVYQLDGGQLLAQREVIGDGGEGAFIQTQGVNVADNVIIVGNAGHGTYQQDGGTTIVRATSASTNASWSAADATGDLSGLVLGAKPGSQGHYLLAAGSLDATPQIVAASGTGSIVQSGGTNSTGSLQIATQPDSNGSYTLTDGKLIFHPQTAMDSSNDVAISVGGRGSGTFTFGNDKQTGAIYQVGQYGASVVVRGVPTAEGAVRGYGRFNLDGALINNGQMIADGYRHDRTLDLSSFKSVTSTIENPAWGGTNGWFARRRGELKLPSIPVDPGTNTYTWGEDPGDPMLDLVNSVRFKVENAKDPGNVSIALLSAIRTDIPTLPHGHHFIGVWSFDGSDLGGFDAVDLQVRYDDAAAAAMGLDENILKLWEYTPSDGSWHRIMDDTFSRDTLDHIIGGRAPGELTYFAVSAPEPTSLMLVGIGASALILRRRRK